MAAVGHNNRSKAVGNRTRTRTHKEVEGIRMEEGRNREAVSTHTEVGVEAGSNMAAGVEAGSNMAAGEAVVDGGTAQDGRSKVFAVAENRIFHIMV
ncbi:hypothetical protein GGI22_001818 [Coemansia erecta]|nr:hypothetical protein GGI22_001818 [Coemansia erecta]